MIKYTNYTKKNPRVSGVDDLGLLRHLLVVCINNDFPVKDSCPYTVGCHQLATDVSVAERHQDQVRDNSEYEACSCVTESKADGVVSRH